MSPQSTPALRPEAAQAMVGGGPGVLVAEDDLETRRLICDALAEGGFKQIFEAVDGVQCLDMLQKHKDSIRAMVLDLMMPNLSGAHILDKLVGMNLPSIGILMISGHADSLEKLETRYNMAKVPFRLDSMAKPFDVMVLPQRLKRLIMLGSGPSALAGMGTARIAHAAEPQHAATQKTPRATPKTAAKPAVQSPAPAVEAAQTPGIDALRRLEKQVASIEGQLAGLNTAVSNLRKLVDDLGRPPR